MHPDTDDFEAWRQARWQEITGPYGKAKVVANAQITGPQPLAIPGVPGRWNTTADGALQIAAAAADGVVIEGRPVDGTARVPAGAKVAFPQDRTAMVSGRDGAYGVIVMDEAAVTRSGLTGIAAYPYDPAWVLHGEYRSATAGRMVEVDRLTVPRSKDTLPAPVDLAITIAGEQRVLTVLEDLPGRRLLIFTDETNGDGTPQIGRWLLLPAAEPGSGITVDFNRTTLSQHHFSPSVFTCPLEPAGNHLPIRVEAGERALIHHEDASHPEGRSL